MSRYQSFSIHAFVERCSRILTAVLTTVTAAALPLTLLGVGTVGTVLYRLSALSARTMIPSSVIEGGSDMARVSPSDAAGVSSGAVPSQAEEPVQVSGSRDEEPAAGTADEKNAAQAEEPDSDKGRVKEKQLPDTGVSYGNVYVRDGNSHYDVDIPQALNSAAKCRIRRNAGYQVLLVHTHTTESYADSDRSWYSKKVNPRTTDKSESVVAVADEIARKLNKAGIKTLHITTYHDYPEYTGAYKRARQTIQKYLREYPSIEMVIDVHRDAMKLDDGTKIKPTVTIDGKKAAQVMIITGCDNDGKLSFDGWRDNLVMAVQLQKQLADDHPGLARPLYFAPFRYNMDLTPNSLLVEFGTDVNTLSEACYAGRMVGDSLVKLLCRYEVKKTESGD